MRLLRLLTVLSGLALLALAAVAGAHTARTRQAHDVDARLAARVGQAASLLENAFSEGRTVTLLIAQSPVFQALFAARADGVRDGADMRARAAVESALAYLGELYPGSLSEACLIHASGAELARVVLGVPTVDAELSLNEAGNPFFGPTIALPPGAVHQSAPYRSEDTHARVVATSTPLEYVDPEEQGMVHIEITLESLRRQLGELGFPVRVLDRTTGRVVLDSSRDPAGPHRARPARALPPDAAGAFGVVAGDEERLAYRTVRVTSNNVNDWVVVTTEPSPRLPVLAGLDGYTIALAGAALVLLVAAFLGFGLADRREAAERRAAGDRLASLVHNVSDMVTVVDASGVIRFVAGPIETALGTGSEALVGTPFLALAHEDDRPRAAALLGELKQRPGATMTASWRMRTSSGGWGTFETTARNLLEHESVRGVVLTTHDVTQRQELEEQLRHRAFHDPLTHLANRALFYDRVEHALAYERRRDHVSAVLFVDLDDFKLVNDRYGHGAGDELLIGVAARLRGLLRPGDTAARLGGDEFGVLVEGIGGVADALALAQRIVRAFQHPIALHGDALRVTPSVGVADSGTVSGGADELLHAADVAMYAAKRLGKARFELYTEELARADSRQRVDGCEDAGWFVRRHEQRAEVEGILDRSGSIVPVFQPIADLRTGEVVGYEALARFPGRPDRPPNAWFAQAHRLGLGSRLEAVAVRAALTQPCRPAGTSLWVNVSPSALLSADVWDVLPERLGEVVFELTENELISDAAEIDVVLAGLRSRGARIALDDAGSGYAGLRQLLRLRPEIIKLDRVLVQGVSRDASKAALVESFVRYAASVGSDVCAEGIEHVDDVVALAGLGVQLGQGYVVAPPAEPWSGTEPEIAAACATGLAGTERLAGSAAERRLDPLASRLAEAGSPHLPEP